MKAAAFPNVTMPMPFALAHVHAYMIETGEGWVMIDAGFPSTEALRELQQGVKSICGGPENVKTVIITHYHPDHSGLAGWLEQAGAEVILHERDFAPLERMNSDQPMETDYLANHPFHQIAEATNFSWESMRAQLRQIAFPIERPQLVQGGETLTFGGRRLQLIWTPGHTEGHLCVLDVDTNTLFSGDHILARITPHVGLWQDGSRSALHEYEQSLRQIAELSPARALPAHEQPIEDVPERVQQLLAHHAKRRDQILATLHKRPSTATEIAGRVFKGREEPMHMFLAVSETLAHLEALIVEGLVARESSEDGPVFRCV
jgi:glyoxylase-like metal-dependent hydrolase (beta-lactamase superfamily II)